MSAFIPVAIISASAIAIWHTLKTTKNALGNLKTVKPQQSVIQSDEMESMNKMVDHKNANQTTTKSLKMKANMSNVMYSPSSSLLYPYHLSGKDNYDIDDIHEMNI
eukprot:485452_1